jgi:hypothetical protein
MLVNETQKTRDSGNILTRLLSCIQSPSVVNFKTQIFIPFKDKILLSVISAPFSTGAPPAVQVGRFSSIISDDN